MPVFFAEANLDLASYGSIVAGESLNIHRVALKSPIAARTTAASPLLSGTKDQQESRYCQYSLACGRPDLAKKKGHLADCTRLAELWRPSQRLPGTSLASPHLRSQSKAPASHLGLVL